MENSSNNNPIPNTLPEPSGLSTSVKIIIGLLILLSIIGLIVGLLYAGGVFGSKTPDVATQPVTSRPPPRETGKPSNTAPTSPQNAPPTSPQNAPPTSPPPKETDKPSSTAPPIDSSKFDPTKTTKDWQNYGIVNVSLKGKLGTTYNTKFKLQFASPGHYNESISNFKPKEVTPHQIFDDLDNGNIRASPPFMIKNSDGKYLYAAFVDGEFSGCNNNGTGGRYWTTWSDFNKNTMNQSFILTKYPGDEKNTYRLKYARDFLHNIYVGSSHILGEGACIDADTTKRIWNSWTTTCGDDNKVDTGVLGVGGCMWTVKILD